MSSAERGPTRSRVGWEGGGGARVDLIGWGGVGCVCGLFDWLIGRMIEGVICWLVDLSVVCWVGWLVGWFFRQAVRWLVSLWVNLLVGWSIAWLVTPSVC